MQGYLGSDRTADVALIDIAEPARHKPPQQLYPRRCMRVADNDAGAKDGEAGEADVAHGVFLHAHDADIAKPAAGGASYRRQEAKVGDSGLMAATRKGTGSSMNRSRLEQTTSFRVGRRSAHLRRADEVAFGHALIRCIRGDSAPTIRLTIGLRKAQVSI